MDMPLHVPIICRLRGGRIRPPFLANPFSRRSRNVHLKCFKTISIFFSVLGAVYRRKLYGFHDATATDGGQVLRQLRTEIRHGRR